MEEENFLKYHAFFDIFKHNHKAHSAIAYARMGASLERVKQHCHAQNTRGGLIPYDPNEPLTQKTEVDSLKSNNIEDYKASNVGYYKILDHYRKLYESKYGKDIKKMIKEEFPPVGDGPLVAAFHGIIQMGYGYVAGADSVVLEGLAYAFGQYSPFEPKKKSRNCDISVFGKGSRDILDILMEIRQDKKLLEDMERLSGNEENRKKCPDNYFDWYTMALVQNYSDTFLQFTDDLKLPEFFDTKKEDMDQLSKLLKWLEDMAAIVYVKSEFPNQFFLLHGITATWSMRQVIDLLSYKEALITIRTHICGYFMTYTATTAPDLTKVPEDYWNGDKVDKAAWDIVLRDVMLMDFEDHVPKVVQIMYENWKDDPNGPNSKLYIAGARMAIDCGFNLKPFPGDFAHSNILPE